MGKKAVGIWMRWSINALMILCTWITALGYWVPRVDPAYHGWMPLIGLAMPGLLVVNVLILIWFIVQRYFLLLLFPLCAIGLNYPYISRMWHPWPAPSVTQAAPPQTYRIMTLNMGGAVGRTAEVV
ncbi:MAG: hypothetical protein PHV49_07000, partial [Alistipes sp.]|nr:hypothetical protein [Alistipes sp.]